MFHAHVETLLHHCVFEVHVGARSDSLISTMLVDVSRQALQFETLLLRVKNGHVVLQCFGTRLLECSWACLSRCSHLVLWFRAGMDF